MLHRRQFVTAGAALAGATALPLPALADRVVQLSWDDLIPRGQNTKLLRQLRRQGVVSHGEFSTGFDQAEAQTVTEAYNGKTVRLPGFVVPLDLSSEGVREFILVPFVGACIHVPPPPANQLVLVTTDKPFEFIGLEHAVAVTGTFDTMLTGTELAVIGYKMDAQKIRSV